MSEETDPASSQRQLAAIVFTDVAGYSARMQLDETGTLALVRIDFARMRALCAQHDGEVLKSTGDGLLLCFASVVQAVTCALQIQKEFAARPATALQHRIGIHLGDVFREGGDVAGDGVNIAARLQTKARPGTVCLSQSVHDAVKGKVPLQAESLGPQSFKNIAEPITVYLATPSGSIPTASGAKKSRLGLRVGVVVAIAAGLAVVYWPKAPAPTIAAKRTAPATDIAETDKSIAVLPFTNLSDDKENAYFADGVHEDILTNLANIAELKVISRTSMLQYRDTVKTVRQIGQELGVAYVLEGSVRRTGNKVRVTGQLIRTATDEHLWAKNYDRDLTDIFAIQTEVAHTIVSSLNAVLTPQESASLDVRPTSNPAAYDAYLRSRREAHLSVDARSVLDTALPWLEQAVQLDPQFGRAWAMIGMLQINLSLNGIDREARRQLGREALTKAETLAPDDYVVLQAGAHFYSSTRNRALANERRRRIIELFPGQALAQSAIGLMAQFDGEWSGALAAYRKAYDLDPRNADMAYPYFSLLRALRRYPEAESVIQSMVAQDPENLEYQLWLAELPYYSRGTKTALEEFLARLPSKPGPDELHYHQLRSQTLERLGDPDRLITFWENAGTRWKSAEDAIGWGNAAVAAAYETRGNATAARDLRQAYRVVLEKALVDDDGRQRPYLLNRYGATLALLGEIEPARQALAEVRQIVTTQTDRSASLRTSIAWHNALWRVVVGEKAEALAELKRTFREPFGPNVYELRNEWEGQPLRGDPKFEALFTDPANNAPLL